MTEREARGWNDSEHDVFTRARAYYTPQSRFLLSSVIFEAQGRGGNDHVLVKVSPESTHC